LIATSGLAGAVEGFVTSPGFAGCGASAFGIAAFGISACGASGFGVSFFARGSARRTVALPGSANATMTSPCPLSGTDTATF
jgi:hypothetical protein